MITASVTQTLYNFIAIAHVLSQGQTALDILEFADYQKRVATM